MENTKLFSGKEEFYDLYRPGYTDELLEYLVEACNLNLSSCIADIGAGTGKLTKKFVRNGFDTIAVEPNLEMFSICIGKLDGYIGKNFKAIISSAEDTKIIASSVDLVTVAQAFHWFDMPRFKVECKRILKPNGRICIVYNTENFENTIIKEKNQIQRYFCNCNEGKKSVIGNNEVIQEFFEKSEHKEFDNIVKYDQKAFIGLCCSASYSLKEDDERFKEYVDEFKKLFEKYQKNGVVEIYNTINSYLGII